MLLFANLLCPLDTYVNFSFKINPKDIWVQKDYKEPMSFGPNGDYNLKRDEDPTKL